MVSPSRCDQKSPSLLLTARVIGCGKFDMHPRQAGPAHTAQRPYPFRPRSFPGPVFNNPAFLSLLPRLSMLSSSQKTETVLSNPRDKPGTQSRPARNLGYSTAVFLSSQTILNGHDECRSAGAVPACGVKPNPRHGTSRR